MIVCPTCCATVAPGMPMCPGCKGWITADGGGAMRPAKLVPIGEVKAGGAERIKIGGNFDRALSGGRGIPLKKVFVMTGLPGSGKALALDTPIPTPSSWRTMADLRVGDAVFSDTGEPCRVLACSEVMHDRPCFAVTFSDGDTIVADADHLWRTSTVTERLGKYTESSRSARRAARRAAYVSARPHKHMPGVSRQLPVAERTSSIRTTSQLAETLMFGGKRNHAVALTLPLVAPETMLAVPPYTLGVWLGDGTSAVGAFTGADHEVPDGVMADGYTLTQHHYGTSRASRWTVHGLAAGLRALGVLNNKHIPQRYLRASVAQRLELLRGLMDTDGDCSTTGSCNFNTTSTALRDGFAELLASLGIKAVASPHRVTIRGRLVGTSWRFTFATEFRVFKIARKTGRQSVPERGVHRRRYIESIVSVPSVPVRCITIDAPSKMFLAGRRMIPTHNSTVLQQAAPAYLAAVPDRYVYYISFEQDPSEVRGTFETILGHAPVRLMIPNAMDGGGEISLEDIRRFPPILIVVDSVSRAVGKDLDAGVAMVQYYKKLATTHNCIVFCIFHANKQEDVAGKMAAIHDVDALAFMSTWMRGDPVQFQNPDFRCMSTTKNRGDPADVQVWYRMTGKDEDGKPDGSYRGLEEVPEKASESTQRNPGLPGSVIELEELKEEMRAEMADWRERIAQAQKHVLSLAAKPVLSGKDKRARKPRAQPR